MAGSSSTSVTTPEDVTPQEARQFRNTALSYAIQFPVDGKDVIERANEFYSFLVNG